MPLIDHPDRSDSNLTAGKLAKDANVHKKGINTLDTRSKAAAKKDKAIEKELAAVKTLAQKADTRALKAGPAGKDGRDGRNGKDGRDGKNGIALPAGGEDGQVLSKDGQSFTWKDGGGGGASHGRVIGQGVAGSEFEVEVDFGKGAETMTCLNRTGEDLSPDDVVAVVQQSRKGGRPLIVSRHTTANPYTPDILGPFQAADGYPIDQGALGLSKVLLRNVTRDHLNALGHGTDVLVDTESDPEGIRFYRPSTGFNGIISTPTGFSQGTSNGLGTQKAFIAGGKLWSAWTISGSIYIYWWDKTSKTWIVGPPVPSVSGKSNDFSRMFAADRAGAHAARPTILRATYTSSVASLAEVVVLRLNAAGTSWEETTVLPPGTWSSGTWRGLQALAVGHGFAWGVANVQNSGTVTWAFCLDLRGATPAVRTLFNPGSSGFTMAFSDEHRWASVRKDGSLLATYPQTAPFALAAPNASSLSILTPDGVRQTNQVLPTGNTRHAPETSSATSTSANRYPTPVGAGDGSIYLAYRGYTTNGNTATSFFIAKTDGLISDPVVQIASLLGTAVSHGTPSDDPDGVSVYAVGGHFATPYTIHRYKTSS